MSLSRVLPVLILAILAAAASALEIREKRWGFDGRVWPGRFNILSLAVANPEARDFNGDLTLTANSGLETHKSPPIVQPAYLAAGTQRWVQFHVFVTRGGSDWMLRWQGSARGQEPIDGAQAGPPALVLLNDPQDSFAKPVSLRLFPDDLFPTTVAATDGLAAVALDHVPRWETARREAFLDWIRRGGIVHLVRGKNGEFPQFTETLAALNVTEPRTQIGAGTVVRHETTREGLSAQFLSDAGFRSLELRKEQSVVIYDLEGQFLQMLAGLTKPRIAWALIYLLVVIYVVVIGPVHYRWSKRIPYLRSLAALVAIVAAFGGAFAYSGRRGANEKSQIRSLAIAHHLGGGRHDVMQWVSAFARSGDVYRLSHASPASLYSTAKEFDSVNGAIVNGREGRFEVDIPLFSTRPFVHRGVLNGDDPDVTIEKWADGEGGKLKEIVLQPKPGFPKDAKRAWLRRGRQMYELKRDGARWVLADSGVADESFFNSNSMSQIVGIEFSGPFGFGEDEPSLSEERREARLDATAVTLIARALGTPAALTNSVEAPPLAPNHLQLFVLAPVPTGFHVQDSRFSQQLGRVLYVQDLFLP